MSHVMPPRDTAPAPLDGTPTAMPLPRAAFPAALRRFGSQPVYRVIEVTRDANGRLSLQGRIWHTDLDRLRRFGRALAANSQSHRVVIADARGELVEELPLAGPGERQPLWGDWQQIPLPPMPRPAATPAPPPRVAAPAPRPAPAPVPAPPALPVVQQAVPVSPPPAPLPATDDDVAAAMAAAWPTAADEAVAEPPRQAPQAPPRELPRLQSDVPDAPAAPTSGR
ncbi:hypothetical protein [uncultured Aquincola sp.]|uniref:hypothetical protein n=1 Tax=uncultured Aquincola sp. TaxID=886556 RepID=UPI0032B13775